MISEWVMARVRLQLRFTPADRPHFLAALSKTGRKFLGMGTLKDWQKLSTWQDNSSKVVATSGHGWVLLPVHSEVFLIPNSGYPNRIAAQQT